jgi:hypothetical protein
MTITFRGMLEPFHWPADGCSPGQFAAATVSKSKPMRNARVCLRRGFLLWSAPLLVAAGCHGSVPSAPPDALSQPSLRDQTNAKKLPAAILYTLGGTQKAKTGSIEAFNANDPSQNPQPLYTIAPVAGRGYSLLGVDGNNNLFAETVVGNEPAIKMFPPGSTKPSVACQLAAYPQGMYVANGLLYLAYGDYTIAEYKEPLPATKTCEGLVKTLTDKLAAREGNGLGLFGVAADSAGDVFDSWQEGSAGVMDEFAAGKSYASEYASLGSDYISFYLSISAHGDIGTGVGGYASPPPTFELAVFPKGSRKAKVFNPTGETNGAYLGTGFGNHDTEIFSLFDYPAPTIRAYAFDPATGKVGKLLRTFYDLWPYDQEFALYDPGS